MPPEAGNRFAGGGAGGGPGPATAAAPVLEVTDLDKRFPLRAGLFGRGGGWVNAVNGGQLRRSGGGDPRGGGRERLRQDDAREDG